MHGRPLIEAATAASLLAGVLVGRLIADRAFPADELDLPLTVAR